jgi:hypothetical protein
MGLHIIDICRQHGDKKKPFSFFEAKSGLIADKDRVSVITSK